MTNHALWTNWKQCQVRDRELSGEALHLACRICARTDENLLVKNGLLPRRGPLGRKPAPAEHGAKPFSDLDFREDFLIGGSSALTGATIPRSRPVIFYGMTANRL